MNLGWRDASQIEIAGARKFGSADGDVARKA
jgi:hypothetical protein